MRLLEAIKARYEDFQLSDLLQGKHARFAQRHVLLAAVKYQQVSLPSRCDCGALVRHVANHGEKQWQCPLCGCAFPYVFWKFRTDTRVSEFESCDDLIVDLAHDACESCGETKSHGLCRCGRKRKEEINEQIKDLYASGKPYAVRRFHILRLTEELNALEAPVGVDRVEKVMSLVPDSDAKK